MTAWDDASPGDWLEEECPPTAERCLEPIPHPSGATAICSRRHHDEDQQHVAVFPRTMLHGPLASGLVVVATAPGNIRGATLIVPGRDPAEQAQLETALLGAQAAHRIRAFLDVRDTLPNQTDTIHGIGIDPQGLHAVELTASDLRQVLAVLDGTFR